jgi:hypothetical protein
MAAYRALVYETPGFTDYFFNSTPIREIAELNIGSRPASRKASQRIEDLRAIPWGFSWGQCRLTLPGWYGFGSAVEAFLNRAPAPDPKTQRPCCSDVPQWPFFRTLLSNMDMVLAKSDLALASRYSELVTDTRLRKRMFTAIEAEWHRTADALARITGDKQRLAQQHRRWRAPSPPLPLHRPAAPPAGGAGAPLPRARAGRRARADGHPHLDQRHCGGLAQLMVGPPGGQPVLAQMVTAFRQQGRSVIAVQEVPADQVHRYGIVAGEPAGGNLIRIERIVEKPKADVAPSRMGVAGRYILTPGIFERSATSHAAWAARSSSPTASPPDGARSRVRLPVRRQALRLRQQGRLSGGHGGAGLAAPAGGRARSATTC